MLHFYLAADWSAFNQEWQNRNQFEDSIDRPPILTRLADNTLLIDAFTTGTYMPHDRYLSYYTVEEVIQIAQALQTVFSEEFEHRLDRIQQCGRDVTLYRGNREYYFKQYFENFLRFYSRIAQEKKAVILQAIV